MAQEDNPFDQLFGNNSPFSDTFKDLLRNPPKKPQHDPHANALLETFTQGVNSGDTKHMHRAVLRYQEDVYARINNTALLLAYAKAAIFANDLEIGQASLEKLATPTSRQIQATGLVAYARERYKDAVCHFLAEEENLMRPARIPYSLSLAYSGKRDSAQHHQILLPLIETSPLAHSILGYLLFEEGDTQGSQDHFAIAADLKPSSEKLQLDALKAKLLNGKKIDDISRDIGRFYTTTNSTLPQPELVADLAFRDLTLPKAKITNLYAVVNSLLR